MLWVRLSLLDQTLIHRNRKVNAQTGSGKTATFALPILQKLARDPFGIFALIITPNRELAFQISEQFNIFGTSINLRVATIVGGLDIIRQKQELDKIPHIVVATPGRLADLLENNTYFQEMMKNLQFLVMDEADRLFDPTLMIHIETV